MSEKGSESAESSSLSSNMRMVVTSPVRMFRSKGSWTIRLPLGTRLAALFYIGRREDRGRKHGRGGKKMLLHVHHKIHVLAS